jgi:hypothetical protein
MRSRALILALVAPLLAAVASSPGHAEDSDGVTSRAAAVASPRFGFAQVDDPGSGTHLTAGVHVDPGLQRVGLSVSFTRPDTSTWGRVWLGETTGGGGCTHEVVLQGSSKDASTWVAREAGGAAIPVVADYSATAYRQLRVQLTRPGLPDGCVVAELWSGNTGGPTELVKAGERALTNKIAERSLLARFKVKYRVTWGETTVTDVGLSTYLNGPSVITDVVLGLAPTSQGQVVDAESAPIDWDFWADGSTDADLPVTSVQPWGTRVLPSVTADEGTRYGGDRRIFIRSKAPTDWVGTLAGERYWHPAERLGANEFPGLTFLDDTWVFIHRNSKVVRECTSSTPQWGWGCHRYWYDAATGRLQLGQLQARVTDTGWWWQGDAYDRSFQVRSFARGETRNYHGTGTTQICCHHPKAEVSLRKDGRYRIVRGRQTERGHYRAIGSSMLRLDPGPRGGRTKVVQLDFFGRMVDGSWQLRRVRLGNTLTLPD